MREPVYLAWAERNTASGHTMNHMNPSPATCTQSVVDEILFVAQYLQPGSLMITQYGSILPPSWNLQSTSLELPWQQLSIGRWLRLGNVSKNKSVEPCLAKGVAILGATELTLWTEKSSINMASMKRLLSQSQHCNSVCFFELTISPVRLARNLRILDPFWMTGFLAIVDTCLSVMHSLEAFSSHREHKHSDPIGVQ